MSGWLTAAQIDDIIANASADDIIEAMARYDAAEHSLQMMREIFDRSAERMGMTNGVTASQMVPATAFREFTQKLGNLVSADNPLPEATEDSPSSADDGE